MNSKEKTFLIDDVLTVVTGKFIGRARTYEMNQVVSHLMGRNVALHEVGGLRLAVLPGLYMQHPRLNDVNAETMNAFNQQEWLNKQRTLFGSHLRINTLAHPEKILPVHRRPPTIQDKIVEAHHALRR